MEKLQSKEQFEQMKNEERTIFMFSADWCPDCKVLEPRFATVRSGLSGI